MSIVRRFFISLVWLGAVCLTLTPAVRGQSLETVTIQLSPTVGQSIGIFSQRPETWSGDASTAVLVFGNYVGQITRVTYQARTYLQFPTSLTSRARVQRATLSLYTYDWPFDGSASMGVYRVTEGWTESLTWGSRPTTETEPVDQVVVSSTDGSTWHSWNVTTPVRDWHNDDANYGLMVAGAPSPDTMIGDGWAVAAHGRTASDPARAPVLEITYYLRAPGEIPEPSTIVLLAGGITGLTAFSAWRRTRARTKDE